MNKTRYSATEFGRNKPMNFRPSGTLRLSLSCNLIEIDKETDKMWHLFLVSSTMISSFLRWWEWITSFLAAIYFSYLL